MTPSLGYSFVPYPKSTSSCVGVCSGQRDVMNLPCDVFTALQPATADGHHQRAAQQPNVSNQTQYAEVLRELDGRLPRDDRN